MASSYLVLLRAGFTWPAGHPAAGGLLPHHFTLTGSRRRCHFCGTFLRVTPTGRYPAPCSVEPGLSSPSPDGEGAATRPPRPSAILAEFHRLLGPRIARPLRSVEFGLARFHRSVANAERPRVPSVKSGLAERGRSGPSGAVLVR